MLEILAIIYLGKNISRIAKEKGLKPGGYVALMVVLWFGLEVVGAFMGILVFGEGLAAYPLALVGAGLGALFGYLIVKGAKSKIIEGGEVLDADLLGNSH